MPARQVRQVVFADEKEEFRVFSLRAQLFHGLDGIGWRRAIEFQPRGRKALFVRDRRVEHLPAHCCAGRRVAGLMRRLRGQNKDHFRETEGLERFAREDQMSVVDRIETAAVDADLFQTESVEQILRAHPSRNFCS